MSLLLLWTLVLCAAMPLLHADLLSSVTDVNRVLYAESDLSMMMDDYIVQERHRLNKLEEVARDYRTHSEAALQQPEKSLGNLVSTFVTMKRFTVDWQSILETYLESNNTAYLLRKIHYTAQAFPGVEDLESTARALLRLQDTYALSPASMARGDVQGMKGAVSGAGSRAEEETLNPDDCFEVGKIAYGTEDYYHAILWMEHALQEMKDGVQAQLDVENLYDHLNYAYYLKNDVKKARSLVKEWLELNPKSERAGNNLRHYEEMLAKEVETETCENKEDCLKPSETTIERSRDEWQQSSAFHRYEALCRGEQPIVIKDEHKLYCSFKRAHPLFYYAPLREELLHFEPQLVMYHDLLSEREVLKARELAIPKLHRSGIFRSNPDEPVKFTEHRTSMTSWLEDGEHQLIESISRKSAAVVNLTLDTVEQLQVVSYGIGGHYEPHYDFSRDGEVSGYDPSIGNRVATVICYLADVDAGGATVFPELGARVTPRKGSCAVWYNLLLNGTQDFRTLHAGCPVLTGSKWIGTKWFHEQGQEFVRKCDVNPQV